MAKANQKIQVALADDHVLLRSALAKLISSFENYTILFEADNGVELRSRLQQHAIPDIVLLDVNMPGMDGFETTRWIFKNFPQIKVLALSMLSDERTIINMLRLGAKGYLLKNAEPSELKEALDSVINKNFYLSEFVSGKLLSGLHNDSLMDQDPIMLSDKEKDFLRLSCSELSYKDIAEKMFLSPRTIDDYRQTLFAKLKVHSRVGLVIYAIKNGIMEIK